MLVLFFIKQEFTQLLISVGKPVYHVIRIKIRSYLTGIFDGTEGRDVFEFMAANGEIDAELLLFSFTKRQHFEIRFCSQANFQISEILIKQNREVRLWLWKWFVVCLTFEKRHKAPHVYLEHHGNTRVYIYAIFFPA